LKRIACDSQGTLIAAPRLRRWKNRLPPLRLAFICDSRCNREPARTRVGSCAEGRRRRGLCAATGSIAIIASPIRGRSTSCQRQARHAGALRAAAPGASRKPLLARPGPQPWVSSSRIASRMVERWTPIAAPYLISEGRGRRAQRSGRRCAHRWTFAIWRYAGDARGRTESGHYVLSHDDLALSRTARADQPAAISSPGADFIELGRRAQPRR